MDRDIENLIEKRIEWVQERFALAGYPKFSISFDVLSLKAGFSGFAYYKRNHIEISSDYLSEFPERIVIITVPHEVVHLYVHKYTRAKQHHGPEFRKFMRYIGLEGKTRHDMKLVNGPTRKTRAKIRYLYTTINTNQIVHLTPHQHKKVSEGSGSFMFKGEGLVFTSKKITIK